MRILCVFLCFFCVFALHLEPASGDEAAQSQPLYKSPFESTSSQTDSQPLAPLLAIPAVSAAPGSESPAAPLPSVGRNNVNPDRRAEPPGASEHSEFLYEPVEPPEGLKAGSLLLRLVLGTVCVALVSVGSLKMLQKRLAPQLNSEASSDIRVRSSLHLGNRCVLNLVATENQSFLVACDSHGIKSVVAVPRSFDAQLEFDDTSSALETTQTTRPLAFTGGCDES